ncbi:MAG: hypothetical protein A4E68_00120 [Syntrophaceae bacterium PtaB.Bin095]|nr:MAG: hypothetical protein A4E68_00120 [Syntrophaceae bacterium PtaB.Bin095]
MPGADGVLGYDHPVAGVRGAHAGCHDAVVGVHTGNHQVVDAHLLQDVVDGRAAESPLRRLVDDRLVGAGRQLRDDAISGVPDGNDGGETQTGKAAFIPFPHIGDEIGAIHGDRSESRVEDLHSALSKGGKQFVDDRNDFSPLPDGPGLGLRSRDQPEEPGQVSSLRGLVHLHVDDQQGRAVLVERHELSFRSVIYTRNILHYSP